MIVSHVAKNSLRDAYQEFIMHVGIAYKKWIAKLTFPQLKTFPYHSYKFLIVPLVHNPKSSQIRVTTPKIWLFEMYSWRSFSSSSFFHSLVVMMTRL